MFCPTWITLDSFQVGLVNFVLSNEKKWEDYKSTLSISAKNTCKAHLGLQNCMKNHGSFSIGLGKATLKASENILRQKSQRNADN